MCVMGRPAPAAPSPGMGEARRGLEATVSPNRLSQTWGGKGTIGMNRIAIACVAGLSASTSALALLARLPSPPEVRLVLDEAEAVIDLLESRRRGDDLTDADWRSLTASEGYRRLKRRQESFDATGFDDDFRAFVRSDEALEELDALRGALETWRSLDIHGAAERASAYLPRAAHIRASIYPVIKRSTNSFVFELDSDPAIFVHIDPERPIEELENVLAHELHHVGSAACPPPSGIDTLPAPAKRAVEWLSGLGEGLAVLAAAGGPDVHPHASSGARAWSVWERDVANFNRDVGRIEAFFTKLMAGDLAASEQREALFALINTDEVPQGPFYTVGWKMAALVERVRGPDVVVDAVCDPRLLLSAYNEIAASLSLPDGDSLALWSPEFLDAIGARTPTN